MRFLVTGATGFVGSAVAERLAQGGTVTGLARSAPERCGMTFVCHDISEPIPDVPGLDGATVVHCAGEIRSENAARHWRSNVVGTSNLLEWCTRHRATRLVLLSTGAVYGYVENRRMREDDPARPAGVYAETKYQAEIAARHWAERHGMALVILRLYFPYNRHPPAGMFRRVDDALRTGATLTIKRAGAPRMTPVHRRDAVDAVLRAVVPEFPPGCYNLCGDDAISFLDLVRGRERRLGATANLIMTDEACGDMMGDNGALRATGWRPGFGQNDIIDPPE